MQYEEPYGPKAMDFFQEQARSRRHTWWLVGYFLLGSVLLVCAVYLSALLVLPHVLVGGWWHPRVFLWSALGTVGVVGIGTLTKVTELSRGGSSVAEMVGGQLVSPGTNNPLERKLLNVVEEMSIAAGMAVPQVYILSRQNGINAFAAGFSSSDAAVAVTRGALEHLTRDELQGVIAHEFSHILNGDMRLNIRLISLIFGITCLAVIGRILLQIRSRGGRGKNPLPVFGLVLLLIGSIGSLFGRLIQSAVSRQREFLADASAVQFTRNPSGLAGALKKIGGAAHGSMVEAAHASEVAHLFFCRASRAGWFDTHPPLTDRIRALEPDFDGVFPLVTVAATERAQLVSAPRVPLRASTQGVQATSPALKPRRIMENFGMLQPGQVRYAEALRGAAPPRLLAAARQPMAAAGIVYALLLSRDPDLQARQVSDLQAATSAGMVNEMLRILPLVQDMAVRARLPLVDLVIPTLKLLSPAQFAEFSAALDQLMDSDEQIDLFEFALGKIVDRHVSPAFRGADRKITQYYSLGPLMPDCAVLLSALAHCSPSETGGMQSAFDRGAQILIRHARLELPFVEDCQTRGLEQISAALDRLAQAAPQIKKNVLLACAQTVAADGLVHEAEVELLRAIADTLDCPLPPFVPDP